MNLLLTTIGGLISGIISSILFMLILSMMRPKLKISPTICKGTDIIGDYYGIKILNDSKFNILDMKIELILKTPFNSNGGSNYTMEYITLRKDNILLFPRYKKNQTDAPYALIVATRDDLENRWSDQAQHLEVMIHCKHSFSGITKSFSYKYFTKRNCIKKGLFNFGKTFEIS